eukprot:5723118-Pyramimonas_sp.AAC.1
MSFIPNQRLLFSERALRLRARAGLGGDSVRRGRCVQTSRGQKLLQEHETPPRLPQKRQRGPLAQAHEELLRVDAGPAASREAVNDRQTQVQANLVGQASGQSCPESTPASPRQGPRGREPRHSWTKRAPSAHSNARARRSPADDGARTEDDDCLFH